MSVVSSFRPTGLLSGMGQTTPLDDPTDASLEAGPSSPTTFKPSGLLGIARSNDASIVSEETATDIDNEEMDVEQGELSTQAELEKKLLKSRAANSTFSFKTTSTLVLSSTSIRPTEDTPTRRADEAGEIPNVFNAFGPPTFFKPADNPPTCPASDSRYLRAKTFSGRIISIRKKDPLSTNRSPGPMSSDGLRSLLDLPVNFLEDQLSIQKRKQLEASDQQAIQVTTPEDILWVDRYRPTRFTDLVGNDRIARDILGWIKQWDYCVFGKRNMKGKKRARDDENVNMEDEYRRPKEKILLLSGPPGLGKTTMAHVLAQQAGYEVVEINASDTRGERFVDERILPTLESGSAVGGTKPVLMVIDEIDGATGGGDGKSFISSLISLTYDRSKRTRNKKVKGKRPILRPIICICNDINASSLAKLRPHTYQIRLQRPADIHTVKRLRHLCETEGLRADARALSTLVGVAKGDLRGCINTLQFIKSRNEDVTEGVIRRATTGMKEGDVSLISVLNEIFTPPSKKRAKEMGMTDEEESRYVSRLSRAIDSSGRDFGIAVGCFAHYPHLRRHDADFARYHQASEWLMTYDAFSSAMYHDGEGALIQYRSYMLVPFHPLFRERGGPKVERDQLDWDVSQITKSNEEIYRSLSRCLQMASTRHRGAFRHLGGHPILQLEFAPYINRIINPPLRPVNFQIIKPNERAVLIRLVSIMSALELRFVQERGEDGQLTYRLDPAADVFITYDGKRAPDIGLSRYAVRHLVAQEIDAELLKRSTDIVEKEKRGKHTDMFGPKKTQAELNTSTNADDADEVDEMGRPRKRANVSAMDIADKLPVDFFGRPIAAKVTPKHFKGLNNKRPDKVFRIAYKYVEGNSAAVRKPVKIESFI